MSLGEVIAALDRAIDGALAEKRITGCALLLAEAGRIVHARHAGMADREAGEQYLVLAQAQCLAHRRPVHRPTFLRATREAMFDEH